MPPIRKKVHINVDLGEGYGNFKCGPDDELIPLIDHANVACGFHAGKSRHGMRGNPPYDGQARIMLRLVLTPIQATPSSCTKPS